jgi:acyl-CoA reductase-like NAD-dependent aldehyde dehydrogenase
MTQVNTNLTQGKLFINNEWVNSWNGQQFQVINPATEEPIAFVAQGGEPDVDAAVQAARKAFEGEWGSISGRERGRYLYKIAELLKLHKEELARIETMDNGKPISETLNADLPLAIECFEHFAGLADKIGGETIPISGDFLNYTTREPVGVVGQIIPWNFPLLMLAWKVAPALASGCTVVLKPAEQTPLTALEFGKLVKEIGLPEGVVNIVTGDGTTGAFLSNHTGVDKIAFTGSTEVGKLIAQSAGKNIKRVSLELGGKAPNIVFADADLDAAVQGVITSIFFNQGEVCCAGSRLYVEEVIREDFLNRLKFATEKLVQGNPLDPTTNIGSLISKEQYDKVLSYIDKGVAQGAKVISGGRATETGSNKGFFVQPTILEATDDNICAKEEIFGPVVTVMSFTDHDDLVVRANNTNYGLSAGIWTQDIRKAHRLARDIKAGTIWINCYNVFDAASPFGGFKDSGTGREMGKYAIELYTEVKSTIVNLG